eukprot:1271742-Rhodomonas_salina.1
MRLPRGLQGGRRRGGSAVRWQASRESRELGTEQGRGGLCCDARSGSEAGETAGSTCQWSPAGDTSGPSPP